MPRRILTRGALRVTRDNRIHVLPQSIMNSVDFPLLINPVRERDAGEYRCLFQLGNKLHHKSIILTVKVPPYFEERPPKVVTADENGNLRLFCNASGAPSPKLQWWVVLETTLKEQTANHHAISHPNWRPSPFPVSPTNNSQAAVEHTTKTWRFLYAGKQDLRPIESVLSHYKNDIFVRGGLLVFSQLQRKMSGFYICEATNGISPAAISETRVLVRYAPEIKMSHNTIQQYLGESTVIGCTVKAHPMGLVEWELNHVPIPSPPCNHINSRQVKFCQGK
ncbi:hypothetical protein PHET_00940 [Paragonimus heterotremus]|uniref:Ig-like domain-containing protein n=1 Tax=Paragonimus heterotremus TaxID=100268 RepID=A0A8J4WLN5_9TREM|nr:hypothetical protein PHET_00940 [Paragonimus heterotremus]